MQLVHGAGSNSKVCATRHLSERQRAHCASSTVVIAARSQPRAVCTLARLGHGVAASSSLSRSTSRTWAAASSGSASSSSQSDNLLRTEIKALEAERDTAVSTAESCAKTATKLAEMATLLEQLALEKVRQGDELGARQALDEKSSVMEALDKNSAKADVNYKLAAVLAKRISDKQSQLLATLRPSTSSSSSATTTTTTAASPSYASPSSTYSSSPYSSSSTGGAYSSSSYSSYSSSSSSSSSSQAPQWKWQQSLEQARERLKQQEAEAAREGRMARLGAEASIVAAKERIAAQAARSVREGQERLRAAQASSGGTLEAVQARLRARDEEALAYVRRIMARYRAGEYVSEEDLDYAFSVLERRFVM